MLRNTRGPESIFRSSEFRRYYAGQALSYLGDGLRTLVIPLLVFHLTASAVSLGLTFAFELLPFALFSLLGGSLADRLDRRKLMLGSDAVRFVIMALFTLALVIFNFAWNVALPYQIATYHVDVAAAEKAAEFGPEFGFATSDVSAQIPNVVDLSYLAAATGESESTLMQPVPFTYTGG